MLQNKPLLQVVASGEGAARGAAKKCRASTPDFFVLRGEADAIKAIFYKKPREYAFFSLEQCRNIGAGFESLAKAAKDCCRSDHIAFSVSSALFYCAAGQFDKASNLMESLDFSGLEFSESRLVFFIKAVCKRLCGEWRGFGAQTPPAELAFFLEEIDSCYGLIAPRYGFLREIAEFEKEYKNFVSPLAMGFFSDFIFVLNAIAVGAIAVNYPKNTLYAVN